MVIGGCLGSVVGRGLDWLMPDLVDPGAFAVVGMAGFFASCARAPVSTILMVAEITGGYALLLPTIWVCFLSMLLNRRHSLYIKQVPTRLDSPAHRGDYLVDLLQGMLVADVFDSQRRVMTIHEGRSLDEIVHLLAETTQRYFPVVDHEGNLEGIFSSEDLRAYLFDDVLWKLANARDVMKWPVVTVQQDDDLNTALRLFTGMNVDEIPVVDSKNPKRLLGMLRRKDLTSAYNQKLIDVKRLQSIEA